MLKSKNRKTEENMEICHKKYGISELWSECITSFESNNSSLRGYGDNYQKDPSLFVKIIGILMVIRWLAKKLDRLVLRLLSLIYFSDGKAYKKYGLDRKLYSDGLERHCPGMYRQYLEHLRLTGSFYSYSSLRTYYYHWVMFKHFSRDSLHVFEIGAGMGNLAKLIIKKTARCSYVVLDLPPVAKTCRMEFINSGFCHEVECHEINDFKAFVSSTADKKIIWITPDKMDEVEKMPAYDIFLNTESFGEMPRDVLGNYLQFAKNKLKHGGIIFMVNRFSRHINPSSHNLDSVTSIIDYDFNGFDVLEWSVDALRMNTEGMHETPNFVFVGKKIY